MPPENEITHIREEVNHCFFFLSCKWLIILWSNEGNPTDWHWWDCSYTVNRSLAQTKLKKRVDNGGTELKLLVTVYVHPPFYLASCAYWTWDIIKKPKVHNWACLKTWNWKGKKKTDWRNSLIENYKTLSVVFPCKSEEWALCQMIDVRIWKTFSQKEERIRVTMRKKKNR